MPSSRLSEAHFLSESYSAFLNNDSLCVHMSALGCHDCFIKSTLNKRATEMPYFDMSVSSKDRKLTLHSFSLESNCMNYRELQLHTNIPCFPALPSWVRWKAFFSISLWCVVWKLHFHISALNTYVLPLFCPQGDFMHHHFLSRFTLSQQAPQKAEKLAKKVLKEDKRANTLKLYPTLYPVDKLCLLTLRVLLFITRFSLVNLYFICEHCLEMWVQDGTHHNFHCE